MGVPGTALADATAAAAPALSEALPQQVVTTPAADELIARLRAKHGPLMFHQSGGCCDGSSPMCYPLGDFLVGDSDLLLATLGEPEPSNLRRADPQSAAPHSADLRPSPTAPGVPFYMSRIQFEYWKHTQLILDVVPGRGGMFSLDGPEGLRFLIRSRVFTDAEIAALKVAGRV
jgi:uncharacterized protein